MNEVQEVLAKINKRIEWLEKETPIAKTQKTELHSWANKLAAYLEQQQQKPSDSGRTASEVNRDVHSAAQFGQLREWVDAACFLTTHMLQKRASEYWRGQLLAYEDVSNMLKELADKEAASDMDGGGVAAE